MQSTIGFRSTIELRFVDDIGGARQQSVWIKAVRK
jgi:hypothetical protein